MVRTRPRHYTRHALPCRRRGTNSFVAIVRGLQSILSVALTNGTRLGPYEPTVFTAPNYDVPPDGRRFLMLKRREQEASAPTHINVVLNWFEELKRCGW